MSTSTWFHCAAAAGLLASAGVVAAGAAVAETPQLLARAATTEATRFDIYFPPQHKAQLEALTAAQADPASANYHKWLTPAQFQQRFGPSDATVARVTSELHAAGFTVESRSALGLHVAGSVGAVERAFAVQLAHAAFAGGMQQLVANRPLALSATLAAAGAHVAQYTTAPPLRQHLHVLPAPPPNYVSEFGPYYTDDLRQAYDFPSLAAVNGKGVTVGILMNGDWNETGADMALYFKNEGAKTWVPKITTVNVMGGAPFDPNNSAETHLDIQQSAGMALGVDEVLFNLPDLSEASILYGLTTIDFVNATDVVNMSFGGAEVALLPANNNGTDLTYLLEIAHSLYLQGNAQGITFVASSGDNGAIPVFNKKPTLTVECPACDPAVTAVGGTNLQTLHSTTTLTSAYKGENAKSDPMTTTAGEVWGSGGGISVVWAKPDYQKTPVAGFTTPGKGRTVPDLALHMGGCQHGFGGFKMPCGAGRSSDWLWIAGQAEPVIGTSASAPDITGMLALQVKLLGGRLGNVNTAIYSVAKSNGKKAFHHAGIVGDNGKYTVKAPYDLVIGNGTADARQLLGATNLPAAGIPGTASNP